jgi:hypothetical protein
MFSLRECSGKAPNAYNNLMDEVEASAPEHHRFTCPGCSEEVDVPAETAGQLVRCPYCNTDFFASVEHVNAAVVDDTTETFFDPDLEFNKLRIQQYTALRRGAIRARSWWLVTQIACMFIVLDTAGQIFVYLASWHRWGIRPTIGLLVLLAAVRLGVHARRRARDFLREIDTSALTDPTEPPDFSTLGDGSEMLRNFEKIR